MTGCGRGDPFGVTGWRRGVAFGVALGFRRGHPLRSCVGLLGSASPSLREREGLALTPSGRRGIGWRDLDAF